MKAAVIGAGAWCVVVASVLCAWAMFVRAARARQPRPEPLGRAQAPPPLPPRPDLVAALRHVYTDPPALPVRLPANPWEVTDDEIARFFADEHMPGDTDN